MLDLATIGIAFDTSGLEKGRRALDDTGKAADRTADSTEKLGKATDVLSRLYRDLGVAAAAYKVFQYVKDMAMLSARYEELGVVMTVVGRNAGYTAAQMAQYAKETQSMGISMIESRNTVIQLSQAQINLADASTLARVAQDAAVIGNTNSSDALQRMIYGIKSGQIETLRTLGINVSFEQSYTKLAASLHVTTAALSEKQKMQARENAVIEEGIKLVGTYEAAMGTAGKQIRSMERYTEDLKVMQGQVFNEALTIGVMALTEHLKDANGEISELTKNGQLKEWGRSITTIFAYAVDSAINVFAMLRTVGAATVWLALTAADAAKGMANPISHESEQTYINKAFQSMLKDITKSTGSMVRAMQERRAAMQAELDKEAAMTANPTDKRLWNSVPRPSASPDTPVKASKDKASEYDRITESIQRQNDTVDEELAHGDKIAASRAFEMKTLDALEKAYADGKITFKEWSKGYDAMDVVTDKMIALEARAKAFKTAQAAYAAWLETDKEIADAAVATSKAYEQGSMAVYDYVNGINEQNNLTKLEISLMGTSTEARNIALGQYRIELELKKQIAAIDANTGFDEAQRIEYRAKASEAASKAMTGIVEKAGIDYAQGIHDDVKSALANAFRDTSGNPLQAFGNALGNVIFTRVTNSLADALATAFLKSAMGTSLAGVFTSLAGVFTGTGDTGGWTDPMTTGNLPADWGVPSAFGNVFGAANMEHFAAGGAFTNRVVDQPTPFRFARGGGFALGEMGEAGPEAVMPLVRGAGGKLGVQASGGASVTNVTNININASVGDIASKADVVAGMQATASAIASRVKRSQGYGGSIK